MLLIASAQAVEFDTVIAASGLLSVLPRVQRVKLGPAHAGQRVHVWADESTVHIVINGTVVKTVPSNLAEEDLDELRLRGATAAGPPPALPSPAPIGGPAASQHGDRGRPQRRREQCRRHRRATPADRYRARSATDHPATRRSPRLRRLRRGPGQDPPVTHHRRPENKATRRTSGRRGPAPRRPLARSVSNDASPPTAS
jgi:hypothetical protein